MSTETKTQKQQTDRLNRYVQNILERPEFEALRKRAYRDITIWGDISPETYRMKDELIAKLGGQDQ